MIDHYLNDESVLSGCKLMNGSDGRTCPFTTLEGRRDKSGGSF